MFIQCINIASLKIAETFSGIDVEGSDEFALSMLGRSGWRAHKTIAGWWE
jgi:hypothetical protein